jgi:RNA exonuclease 4
MYNKIVVGHTVWKDLEVCGLKEWKGWKALVDISEYADFKEKNGKLISLKNLTSRFLSRSIQEGRHSSVEDCVATMDLYRLRKQQILHQLRII